MSGIPSRLSDFIPYRLAITSAAVTNYIVEEYEAQFGLRIPEWRIMIILGDSGRMTQRQLVRSALMDKVAINRACKALEDRQLVRRLPNAADGRSHHVELTDAGSEMLMQIWPQAQEAYARIFNGLSEREIVKLRELLDKVLRSVSDAERG